MSALLLHELPLALSLPRKPFPGPNTRNRNSSERSG